MDTPTKVTMEAPGPTIRRLSAAEAESFVKDVLFADARTKPVVAVTTKRAEAPFLLDPAPLADALGDRADVVAIETGDATWALSAAMPKRLDVYGGAARIWWPGLRPDANPLDHPLLFIWNAQDSERVLQRIVAAIVRKDPTAGRWGQWGPAQVDGAPVADPAVLSTASSASSAPAAPEPAVSQSARGVRTSRAVVDAVVEKIEGSFIRVSVAGEAGALAYCDERKEALAGRLKKGEVIRAYRVNGLSRGLPKYSTQGLGAVGAAGVRTGGPRPVVPRGPMRPPRVNPWSRLAAAYEVGDVVLARVARIADSYILVELLPSATALVPIHELDWTRVKHPNDLFKGGETVAVRLLTFEPEERRCTASVKEAYGKSITKAPPLGPEDVSFQLESSAEDTATTDTASSQLQEELDSALEDREQLMGRLRTANDQVTALKKDLRSAEDKVRALEASHAAGVEPTASELAFLAAVRVEYAKRYDEADRIRYPLQKMRVGREFMVTLRELDGVEVEKVVGVCAQVASGRAHEVAGRKVHELRSGPAGSSGKVRASDGAKAWRCALQVSTPSARRLHWWHVPGEGGATVEFAAVAIHDNYSVPE